MPRCAVLSLLVALLFTLGCFPPPGERAARASNPEIKRLFAEDQQDRQTLSAGAPTAEQWRQVAARDAQRRERARQLFWAESLQTGEDYDHAAMIFQHGETPQDHLLAHILAVTALAKGYAESRRLAAATLDCYLRSVGQPQVFGTQYWRGSNRTFTQGAYVKDFLPDFLRREHCVAILADQARNVAALNRGEPMPAPDGCR
jgi:hypothetical protein